MAEQPQPWPIIPPNYQDLSDDDDDDRTSSSDLNNSEQDWDAIIHTGESTVLGSSRGTLKLTTRNTAAAFSETQVAEMHAFLKERGLFAFLSEYLDRKQVAPNSLLLAFGVRVRPETPLLDQLRMLKIACTRVLRDRERLSAYNSPQDVVDLLRTKKRILILTGAGVSTSCGIPDFRSPTGLYARLKLDPDPRFSTLDDPQDMFDLAFFKHDPSVFYSFAREIYPSNFVPSECHRFVRLLELEGKLLRNYTQNIDGLFEQVGVERMLNCHGSFATASCLLCKRHFPGSSIEPDVYASRVPLCPYCTPELERLARERERERELERERGRKRRKVKEGEWDEYAEEEEESAEEEEQGGGGLGGEGRSEWSGKAVIKPDIVFFGEPLSDEFDHRLVEDREEVDLLIVMGTSLRVSPVAQLPSHLPHSIPQILINRDPVGHHNFDVCLLGDGDTIVRWLCDELAKPPRRGEGEKKEEVEEEEALALALKKKWSLDERVPLPPHAAAAAAQPKLLDSSSAAVAAASSNPNSKAVEEEEEEEEEVATRSSVPIEPEQVGQSHVWLFPGANRDSRWVEAVRVAYGSDDGDADADSTREGEGEREHRTGGDGLVELPASLAPGVIEGEGSDGPDPDSDDDQEEVGADSSSSSPPFAAVPAVPATTNITTNTTTARATTAEQEELQRIAPSFLQPAPDLA